MELSNFASYQEKGRDWPSEPSATYGLCNLVRCQLQLVKTRKIRRWY